MSNVINLFSRQPVTEVPSLDFTDDCSDSVTLAERTEPKRERSEPVTVSGFRWQPLKQRFVRPNVSFSPETQEAYSYGWWRFVERIGPYLVFNSYRYSVTTAKHQREVQWLLEDLGLSMDLYIEAPTGLQDLESALSHYASRIFVLQELISRKGSRKAKNADRLKEITTLQIKIATIQMLQRVRDSQDAKAVEASITQTAEA
jgi:hypothetical protein